jgi:hypothetical protein
MPLSADRQATACSIQELGPSAPMTVVEGPKQASWHLVRWQRGRRNAGPRNDTWRGTFPGGYCNCHISMKLSE